MRTFQLTKLICVAAGILVLTAVPLRAATLQTGSFISSPEYFNGFEAIGVNFYPGDTYSEGGITVHYVGSLRPDARLGPSSAFTGIWTTWTNEIGGEGQYGWYGPGNGYTQIELTNGGDIQSIQFLAGSGWGLQTSNMQYELLHNGIPILNGVVPIVSGNCSTGAFALGVPCDNGGMSTFGFSGGGFNEVRLQNQGTGGNFDPLSFEAAAIDSVAAASAAASPEPASVSLMLIGLAAVSLRSRRRAKQQKR